MSSLDTILAPFDYSFPEELIAHAPAHPRDSAKLLVYNRSTGITEISTFAHIIDFLPKDAVLVFNHTKVIPARFALQKDKKNIEVLYIGSTANTIRVMAPRTLQAGDTLMWANGHSFTAITRNGKFVDLEPSFPLATFHQLLEKYGETPLPPYIHSPLSEKEKREEYQTVYAEKEGSVAAPTAGLHFTNEVLENIREAGHAIEYVALHVNLGTFAPLTEENIASKTLHTEEYEITNKVADRLNSYKKEGRHIIAVGTTTVRTLESAYNNGAIQPGSGSTNIFIGEDDAIQYVDGLITNFHVPKSSLLMLVSAFTGRDKLMELYKRAIDERCRLFSFGDGMLVV